MRAISTTRSDTVRVMPVLYAGTANPVIGLHSWRTSQIAGPESMPSGWCGHALWSCMQQGVLDAMALPVRQRFQQLQASTAADAADARFQHFCRSTWLAIKDTGVSGEGGLQCACPASSAGQLLSLSLEAWDAAIQPALAELITVTSCVKSALASFKTDARCLKRVRRARAAGVHPLLL